MSKSRQKKQKKNKQQADGLKFIKDAIEDNRISESEVRDLSEIDYPLFSFKYLNPVSIDKCNDSKFFFDFLMRLQKLSNLGWNGIRTSERHAIGMEHMPINKIVPYRQLPDFITRDVENLDVFRANGDNRVFVGLQKSKIFHIFFIETEFGDVSCH